MTQWYFYNDGPASGAIQMARDEHALQLAARDGVPRLRLYLWDRLTLSVGRTQQAERQVDLEACRRLGVPVVRRVTGGRAVLHGSDLTYSVASPLVGSFGEAARAGIPGLYRELSRVFVRFFDRLGLAPAVHVYTGHQRAELASPVCFATPSAFEILLGGKKIVGSAQRLLPNAFLQHGSIPLTPQTGVLSEVFRDNAGAEMANLMTDLTTAGVAGQRTLEELCEVLASCFAEEFGAELVPTQWSADEHAEIEHLTDHYHDLALATPIPAPAAD